MTKSWLSRYWRLRLVGTFAIVGVVSTVGSRAIAQVRPDNTLGAESSRVTTTGPGAFQIDGGATRETNLFHSFSQFSVPTNGVASFNNAPSIQNIISRVTGGSVSNINGLLRANGTANLFLINPNGIIFGPNASLNIGGSFLASTASSLIFADGTEFSAAAPQTIPLLTASVPLGLQYGGSAGGILVQGSYLQVPPYTYTPTINTSIDAPPTFTSGGLTTTIYTLALVGGDVKLDGASLRAPGGLVEVRGLTGAGTVGLNLYGSNLSLSFPDSVAQADVSFTNGAKVDESPLSPPPPPRVDTSAGSLGFRLVLPTGLVDASRLIAQGCPAYAQPQFKKIIVTPSPQANLSARARNRKTGSGRMDAANDPIAALTEPSKFIVSGRGGMPPSPTQPLSSDSVLTNWNTLDHKVENRSGKAHSSNPTSPPPTQIVEATGWVIGPKGEVILTAQAPTVTPDIPWLRSASCYAQ